MTRLLVFAYHELGYHSLEFLVGTRENVVGVFSHQDDGDENIYFHSVAELARCNKIPVHTPSDVNSDIWFEKISQLNPDLLLSFAYRLMLDQRILDLPKFGAFNCHPSLLPRYRGRAPINWAVLRGETETGVTIHAMTDQADAGDIIDQTLIPIGPRDSALDVTNKIAPAGARLLEKNIAVLKTGNAPHRKQNEQDAFYVGRRRPEDGRINWQVHCVDVFNLIRAITHPYPGAFTDINNHRLLIWWAEPLDGQYGRPGEIIDLEPLTIACRKGALKCLEIQWIPLDNMTKTSPPDLKVGQNLALES